MRDSCQCADNLSSLKKKNDENGYVVRDGIEVGHNKFIPLWLFGLLY